MNIPWLLLKKFHIAAYCINPSSTPLPEGVSMDWTTFSLYIYHDEVLYKFKYDTTNKYFVIPPA